MLSNRGDVQPPNRGKVMRETSQSLALSVYQQMADQLGLPAPATPPPAASRRRTHRPSPPERGCDPALRRRWRLATLLALSLTMSVGERWRKALLNRQQLRRQPGALFPVLPGAAGIWLRGALKHFRPGCASGGCPALAAPGFMPAGQVGLTPGRGQIRVLIKPGIDAAGRCAPTSPRVTACATGPHAARLAIESSATSAQPLQPCPPCSSASAGGEILAALAPAVEGLSGLVLIAAPGLDPHAWGASKPPASTTPPAGRLLAQASSDAPDETLLDGRSLGYWRDLLQWQQTACSPSP